MITFAHVGTIKICRTPGGPGADPTTVITAGVLRTPSLVAVTLAVPASTPITPPFVDTERIVAALLAHVTRPPTMFPAASFATARNASLRLIPTRARAGRTSTDATGPVVATGCTAIETLARCSPLAAVTVALPGAMPVSDPSMDTDATAESLLDHAMLAPPTTAPAASLARALSWARSPTRTLAGAPTVSTAATDPFVGERSSRYAPTPATATSAAAHGSARLTPGERLAPGSRRKLI